MGNDEKYEIIRASHEGLAHEGGHKGISRTVRAVVMKYAWGSGNVYEDVKRIVRSCEACQRCATKLLPQPIYVTSTSWMFNKVFIDCVGPLPRTVAKHEHVVLAIEDLSGYVEGKALVSKNTKNIAQFIWEEIVLWHGCFTILVSDRGTEFKNKIMEELSSRMNMNQHLLRVITLRQMAGPNVWFKNLRELYVKYVLKGKIDGTNTYVAQFGQLILRIVCLYR